MWDNSEDGNNGIINGGVVNYSNNYATNVGNLSNNVSKDDISKDNIHECNNGEKE